GGVFEAVVCSAEVGEVVGGGVAGVAVFAVGGGVVEVAAVGGAGAAGVAAGLVSQAQGGAEVGGDEVAGAADGEGGAGLGVGEQADEGGCVRGEVAGDLGGDGPVSVEVAGLVAVAQEGQDRDGDGDDGPDAAQSRGHRPGGVVEVAGVVAV